MRRSNLDVVARAIARNARARVRRRLGRMSPKGGRAHEDLSLAESLDYIESVVRDYVSHAPGHSLDGLEVLEIGPGDSLGVALRMLGAGASRVTCVDLFEPALDSEREARIRAALLERMEPAARARASDPARLRTLWGTTIEDADQALEGGQFDLSVSCAVLEEVPDLPRAFRAMDRLLAPGGAMVHRIDLRDYGLFTGRGMNELEFLTLSERLWALMTSHSAEPNRARTCDYREELESRGWEYELLATQVVGRAPMEPRAELRPGIDFDESTRALVDRMRPRLARRFREMPDDALMTCGLLLIATKARLGAPAARQELVSAAGR